MYINMRMVALNKLKIGVKARISHVGKNAHLLAERGIYVGLEFEIFQRNGDSCILRVAGGKITIRTDLRGIKCQQE
ncbi:hypothetical protein LCGC14_2799890 [marine sediment metagenome]|uniref:Ferrous iron transporter FeoA-like domain-containing protein n=1 Tax=marine sediment metagenome TaxID=412755 RepID=A0A0F9AWI4_9ZZZZ